MDEAHSARRELEKIMVHLWEVKHPYYCNEGNYYANESVESYYKTFADFLREWGDSDFDYNLLFRWDWEEPEAEEDSLVPKPSFNGDVNYRNGQLKLFWMGQRKGRYSYSVVEVCRADEPAIRAFLAPRAEYLRNLWSPILD